MHITVNVMTNNFVSEIPTCLPSEDCSWNKALIASRSLSGEYFTLGEDIWRILGDSKRYIHLQFNSFDIECNSQTLMQIDFTNDISSSFCNTNKPVQGINSVNRELTILFRYVREANRFIEGFSGVYEQQSNSLSMDSMITEESMGKFSMFFFIFYDISLWQLHGGNSN